MKTTKVMIPLFAIALSACTPVSDRYGFFKDETQTYRNVKQLDQPVVIPQNLSTNGVQNFYEVPGGTEVTPASNQPPLTPPGSGVQERQLSQQDKIRSAESAKIQGHTTLVAQAGSPVTSRLSYAQSWNKVASILQSANYKIVEKDKALGTYYVVDTHASGGKVRKDMPIYQVNVRPDGNSARVSVSPANPSLQNLIARNLGQ